ncbi:murein biosynthesis integral membrane protein MurJ [Siculibacillus lacustris]|uniref:Probable lipid II flippase MurJ n=1 Tax=Siculibacillus lacustris TaxID=1549641 RepID=A0A4Q9VNL4_9HYPH|nr:murein biosynthesis integral membrane protein MurJ [Siculibacillus lacustris]TBW36409.1 murein biosynthesis integral membrane protein MurJ [Siculibacillus lacustris]
MSLVRNVLTVGGATLASRGLGFVRDTMIAAALGTGPVADAFFVAFRLPNLFRRLFAEGAFASGFVPLLVRARDEVGAAGARRFSGAALAVLLAVVIAVSLIAALAAPALVRLLAPGFVDDPAKFALTVDLTRICFPYLGCVSVVALLAGVLAAERRFLAAALAPVLLNLVFIAALIGLALAGRAPGPADGRVLAVAVVVAGVVQVVLLAIAVLAAGSTPNLRRPLFDDRLRRFGALAVPGLIAGGLTEINVVVATMIASAEPGAVSWLYYADRLYQLPLGVIGIAIGQVLLPEIAVGLFDPDRARADAVLSRALEAALALALPAAVALWVLAGPITVVLFQRGAFGAGDAVETTRAMAALALGLPGFVLVKVFSPAFYAREDTRLPMAVGGVAVAVNVALALAFFPFVGWIAVPVATAAAGWINAALLAAILIRRGHWRIDATLARRVPRLAVAATAMGLVVAIGGDLGADLLAAARPLAVKGATLAVLVALGLAVHGGLIVALGVVDRRTFRRRRADPPCPTPTDAA